MTNHQICDINHEINAGISKFCFIILKFLYVLHWAPISETA